VERRREMGEGEKEVHREGKEGREREDEDREKKTRTGRVSYF
jgi:hypothetical protein